MKYNILCFIFCLVGTFSFAQMEEEESLVTDRPDQTESANIVQPGALQIETGFASEFDREGDLKTNYLSANNMLLRLGVIKNLELRLIWDIGKLTNKFNGNTISEVGGLQPLAIGAKIGIYQDKEAGIDFAFMGHLTLPYFGKEEFRPEDVVPDFRLAFSHPINDNMGMSYNAGLGWAPSPTSNTFEEFGIYTVALGFGITEKLSAFVENYGFIFGDFDFDVRIDAGVTYLVNPNLQFDVSGGLGLTSNAPDGFFSAGVSFLIPEL